MLNLCRIYVDCTPGRGPPTPGDPAPGPPGWVPGPGPPGLRAPRAPAPAPRAPAPRAPGHGPRTHPGPARGPGGPGLQAPNTMASSCCSFLLPSPAPLSCVPSLAPPVGMARFPNQDTVRATMGALTIDGPTRTKARRMLDAWKAKDSTFVVDEDAVRTYCALKVLLPAGASLENMPPWTGANLL